MAGEAEPEIEEHQREEGRRPSIFEVLVEGDVGATAAQPVDEIVWQSRRRIGNAAPDRAHVDRDARGDAHSPPHQAADKQREQDERDRRARIAVDPWLGKSRQERAHDTDQVRDPADVAAEFVFAPGCADQRKHQQPQRGADGGESRRCGVSRYRSRHAPAHRRAAWPRRHSRGRTATGSGSRRRVRGRRHRPGADRPARRRGRDCRCG